MKINNFVACVVLGTLATLAVGYTQEKKGLTQEDYNDCAEIAYFAFEVGAEVFDDGWSKEEMYSFAADMDSVRYSALEIKYAKLILDRMDVYYSTPDGAYWYWLATCMVERGNFEDQ